MIPQMIYVQENQKDLRNHKRGCFKITNVQRSVNQTLDSKCSKGLRIVILSVSRAHPFVSVFAFVFINVCIALYPRFTNNCNGMGGAMNHYSQRLGQPFRSGNGTTVTKPMVILEVSASRCYFWGIGDENWDTFCDTQSWELKVLRQVQRVCVFRRFLF